MSDRPRSRIAGSERRPVAGAQPVASLDQEESIEVTVVLRRRQPLDSSAERLRPDQLQELHGASPADAAEIVRFAAEHGLDVLREDLAARTVVLSGTVGAIRVAPSTSRSPVGSLPVAARTEAVRAPSLCPRISCPWSKESSGWTTARPPSPAPPSSTRSRRPTRP